MSDIPSTCMTSRQADAKPCCGDSDLALLYKALGHPARIDILHVLADCDHACCGEIVSRLSLAQSTVSQHLNVLKCAGLIGCEAKGRCCRYFIRRDAVQDFASLSRSLVEMLQTPGSNESNLSVDRPAVPDDDREAEISRKETP